MLPILYNSPLGGKIMDHSCREKTNKEKETIDKRSNCEHLSHDSPGEHDSPSKSCSA